jgi:hypothetical protein
LQALAGRQAQVQFDDVRRQAFQLFDARGQGLDRNVPEVICLHSMTRSDCGLAQQ